MLTGLRKLFGSDRRCRRRIRRFDRIRRDDAALPWRFADADAATDFLFENSPGHAAALAVADPDEVTGRVREHVRAFAGAGAAGPVDAEAAYVVWTARRA